MNNLFSPHINNPDNPLVTVIITCHNQGKYLQKAIDSVIQQTYKNIELLLVNDGSTDHTKEIADQYEGIKYLFQSNRGLSSARNLGIKNSHGLYISFLDADDWLYPQGIARNLSAIQSNPEAVFVSGGHTVVDDTGNILDDTTDLIHSDHYNTMLERNYIGMHASVLYSREILSAYAFDESLKACEDYDLYLKIIRHHPVIHQSGKIAFYRKHQSNMSNDYGLMLTAVSTVLERQKGFLSSAEEKISWTKGKKDWMNKYLLKIDDKKTTHIALTVKEREIIKTYRHEYRQILRNKRSNQFAAFIKKHLPGSWLRQMARFGIIRKFTPLSGKVNPGDFQRLTPFDNQFGYGRGGPVDRVYIEDFLQSHATDIKGHVLEIGDNIYTVKYGGSGVVKTDILHINDSNPNATIIADISYAPQIPDLSFDCIIITQTLHLIYDFKAALHNCRRMLSSGGVLLLTVPGISPIDKGEWGNTWYWSFTEQSMNKLSAEIFPNDHVEIETHGNVFSATAFLYGMGSPELSEEELHFQDPQYPVIITVKITKTTEQTH